MVTHNQMALHTEPVRDYVNLFMNSFNKLMVSGLYTKSIKFVPNDWVRQFDQLRFRFKRQRGLCRDGSSDRKLWSCIRQFKWGCVRHGICTAWHFYLVLPSTIPLSSAHLWLITFSFLESIRTSCPRRKPLSNWYVHIWHACRKLLLSRLFKFLFRSTTTYHWYYSVWWFVSVPYNIISRWLIYQLKFQCWKSFSLLPNLLRNLLQRLGHRPAFQLRQRILWN